MILLDGQTQGLVIAGLLFVVTFELLRRRFLTEKYAAIWIVLTVVICVFSIFPPVLSVVAEFFGFQLPANFFIVIILVFLIGFAMQISLEVGKLESEVQRLAEEIAVTKLENNDN